jgi:ATP-binding cassette subfamily F protein uup
MEQSDAADRPHGDPLPSPPGSARGRGPGRGGAQDPPAAPPRARRPGKLSFNEQRELEGIEPAILAAEERKSALEATLADPATYQRAGETVPGLRAELDQVTREVERLYARWQELEALRAPAQPDGPR